MSFHSIAAALGGFRAELRSLQIRLFGNPRHASVKQPVTLARIYFCAVPILACAYLLWLQPDWILSGEMYAEMATNYFRYAQSPDLLVKLFALDAGYIPLPQRLTAAVVNLLGFKAAAVPYIYTWLAILLPAFMVGIFCSPVFRPLVRSDAARFVIALIVLAVADFETRTFVNFTYFGIFFCAVVVALALMPEADDAPWWAWATPLLVLSKPYLLIVIPVMAIGALVAKPRMRAVLVLGCLAGVAQIVQIALSAMRGEAPGTRIESLSLIDKLTAAIGNFFGLLGGYTVFGKLIEVPFYSIRDLPLPFVSIYVGVAVAVLLACLFLVRRDGAAALIVVGLSLLFFNCLLNAFASSSVWNTNFARIPELPTQKHIVGGYFGFVLIITALAAIVADLVSRLVREQSMVRPAVLPGLLVAWFGLSGWASWGVSITREPSFPSTGHSQWQNGAAAVDRSVTPLCVPIDPIRWLYANDCRDLAPVVSQAPTRFGNPLLDTRGLQLAAPGAVRIGKVVSVGVPLKMDAPTGKPVVVRAILRTAEGRDVELSGQRVFPSGGGVVLLQGNVGDGISNVETIRIVADAPMRTLAAKDDDPPVVMWMGH